MSNKQTFGQRVICINKTKAYVGKKGYEPTGSAKAVTCSKCPVCGKPSLIHLVKKGENFKDETVGIFGVCFNRYNSDYMCKGKSWVRKASKEVANE